MNERINELRELTNFSKIDSLTSEEVRAWYHTIKNSLDILSKIYSENEFNSIKVSLSEYEDRHGL